MYFNLIITSLNYERRNGADFLIRINHDNAYSQFILDYHEIFIQMFTNKFDLSSQESKILLAKYWDWMIQSQIHFESKFCHVKKMLKMKNPRSIRSAKSKYDLKGKDGTFGCRTLVKEPATTWSFAPGAEGYTGSPGRGSRPRGLRTARVTAECWRGLPARGAPRGMLPAGVDGARSTPTRAHDTTPLRSTAVSSLYLAARNSLAIPRCRAGFKQLHNGLIYRATPSAAQWENGKIIP